ncbi:MAG: ABC transporter permease [Candidatus Moranbacteria bacterium]|nr:ABC transporter permease [Candidatus Moranbacteria bacterium]
MAKKHENYWELVWALARTDFKLRYHGSVLGYVWALLKPLLTFLILNFVFSSIFNPKNSGIQYFSLQLLTSIMLFNFFSEGTLAGLNSLLSKSALVTKIYVPRWTIVIASTINATLIFCMNLIVIAFFFAWYGFWPGIPAILTFLFYIILTFILILSFSFIAAPLYVKFRDLSQIWEVAIQALFYGSPIVYPLQIIPAKYHTIILANPIGFIIHFNKEALTENHYATLAQISVFTSTIIIVFFASIFIFRKMEPRVAENI